MVAAIAVTAGWNVYQSEKVTLSDLAMENVEALASGEGYYDLAAHVERTLEFDGWEAVWKCYCSGEGYLFCCTNWL